MKGNIYICLNEETYNSNLPDIFSRYKRAEYDDEGALVQLLPTTYAQMAEDDKYINGPAVHITIDGDNYYIVKILASWLQGEVSYILSLGEGLSYPSNTLLSPEESSELISSNSSDLEQR